MSTPHRIRLFAFAGGAALALTTALSGTAMGSDTAPKQPADSPQAMAAACQDGWLCVWDDTFGHGKRHDFYKCETVDVRALGLADVRSYVNNQSDGTRTEFWGEAPQFHSDAPEINSEVGPGYHWMTVC